MYFAMVVDAGLLRNLRKIGKRRLLVLQSGIELLVRTNAARHSKANIIDSEGTFAAPSNAVP